MTQLRRRRGGGRLNGVCWRNRKWSEVDHLSFITPLISLSLQAGTTTAEGNIPLVLYDVWKSRGLTG